MKDVARVCFWISLSLAFVVTLAGAWVRTQQCEARGGAYVQTLFGGRCVALVRP